MEKLLYSIISSKRKTEKLPVLLAEMKGIAGSDLYGAPFEGITAIVSNINSADLIADKSTAIEFSGVIENLSKHFTLLPVRFGTMMGSSEAIIKMLERNHAGIQENLLKVENKYEYGLKIFSEPEKLKATLSLKPDAGSPKPDTLAPDIRNSIYREWVNKKLDEHRLEEMLVKYVDSVIAEITEQFGRLKAISKFKKMKTASMIIDAVLLLDKARKASLIATIEDLQNKHSGLTFFLTGPWPPYNFVDFTVK
jgi:hypothetical protein